MWLVLFVTLAHWAGYELIENRESRIENRKTTLVACFLLLARARFPCQRANRMDAACDRRGRNHLHARLASAPALQICPRNFADAHRGRVVGNSGADSNARRIFFCWNRTTRHWPFVYHDGRPRRGFARDVSAASAVLFCNRLNQFFSVVDQVALVGSQIMAEQIGRVSDAPGYSGNLIDSYLVQGSRSFSSFSLWLKRNCRIIPCRRFHCLRCCWRGTGNQLRAAAG